MSIVDACVTAEMEASGSSRLHAFVNSGWFELTKLLLEHGAHVDAIDDDKATPLCIAALKGYHNIAKLLLQYGADHRLSNVDRQTPMHLAAISGHINVVKLLVLFGADHRAFDSDGYTPLHISAIHGHVNVVRLFLDLDIKHKTTRTDTFGTKRIAAVSFGQLLLAPLDISFDYGTDVNVRDYTQCTPLFLAASNGHASVVNLLLQHSANHTITDIQGRAPIHAAVMRGHTHIVQRLLKVDRDHLLSVTKDQASVFQLGKAATNLFLSYLNLSLESLSGINVIDHEWRTPLHLAAIYECNVIARMLLEHGADPRVSDINGQTPMHHAVLFGNLVLVNILLEYEAGYKATDKDGNTPIHLAAMNGHTAIAKCLLEHVPGYDMFSFLEYEPLDIKACDNKRRTPLHLAAERGHCEFAKYLLSIGASYKAQDDNGSTPLHLAAVNGHAEVSRILREYGANHRSGDVQGLVSLKSAFVRSLVLQLALFALPIECDSDISIQDKQGRSPLHHAAFHGHLDVVLLLLSQGAVIDLKDTNDQTALHLATSNGKLGVVKLLLEYGSDHTLQDRDGQTALEIANRHVYDAICNHIFDVDLQRRDAENRKALTFAEFKDRVNDPVIKNDSDNREISASVSGPSSQSQQARECDLNYHIDPQDDYGRQPPYPKLSIKEERVRRYNAFDDGDPRILSKEECVDRYNPFDEDVDDQNEDMLPRNNEPLGDNARNDRDEHSDDPDVKKVDHITPPPYKEMEKEGDDNYNPFNESSNSGIGEGQECTVSDYN